MQLSTWSTFYSSTPPWDVGHPQQAFVKLVESGEMIPSRVLDIGSGPGENTIFLAETGFSTIGIDFTPEAVEIARDRARDRGVDVEFIVGNVLDLSRYFGSNTFDYVIDSGLFHSIHPQDLSSLIEKIEYVLKPNGIYYMLCFSDKEPPGFGPRRISKEMIRSALEPRFGVKYIRDSIFESKIHRGGARAYQYSLYNKIKKMCRDLTG
ncbi:MAG: class I SAM-dependent methyltransferase [Candidatus Thorarchaeota archaeon]